MFILDFLKYRKFNVIFILRKNKLRFYIYLVLLCIGFISLNPINALAQNNTAFVQRSDDELLILAIHNDGYVLNDGFMIYMPSQKGAGHMLVPLREFVNMLRFPIDVKIEDGIAQGWFLEEANSFYLNLADKQASVKGKKMPFEKKIVERHYDDLYVDESLLEEWFDIDLELDFATLTVELKTKELLPFQSELKRRSNAESFLERNKKNATAQVKEEAIVIPHTMLSPHSYVLQASQTLSSNDGDFSSGTNANIQGYGDLFGFTSDYTLNLTDSSDSSLAISDASLTFSKKDSTNSMLGSLKAGKIEFGDIDFPAVSLFKGQQRGRGVSVSSKSDSSFSVATNPDAFIVDGTGPINWDVELYKNGVFAGFQTVGNDGRYSFSDVDLSSGHNIFEIVMYGPEGQKKTETRTVVKGANMLHEGELTYDFAVGQPQSAFIPIADNAPDNSDFGLNGAFSYGVNEFLTVSSGFAALPDATDDTTVLSIPLGISTSFKGMNVNYQFMTTDENQQSHEISALTRIKDFTLSGSYRKNNGFDTTENDTAEAFDLSVSKSFKLISTGLQFKRTIALDDEIEDSIVNRTSLNISDINLSHTITATLNETATDDKDLEGTLLLAKNINDYRLRAELAYDPDNQENKIETSKFALSKNFENDLSFGFNGEHSFVSDVSSFSSRFSKNMGPFALDLNLGANTEQSYSAGFRIRVAAVPEITNMQKVSSDLDDTEWKPTIKYSLASPELSTQGRLALRTFIDINANGKYDDKDTLLEGVKFKSSRGSSAGASNKNGLVMLDNLPETSTTIAIDPSSIYDIYIRPVNSNINIIPRLGSLHVLDFPFEQVGEIEGSVSYIDDKGVKQPTGNAEVFLINPKTNEIINQQTVEYDGYFLFSDVRISKYIVKAKLEDKEQLINVNVDYKDPIYLGAFITFRTQ